MKKLLGFLRLLVLVGTVAMAGMTLIPNRGNVHAQDPCDGCIIGHTIPCSLLRQCYRS